MTMAMDGCDACEAQKTAGVPFCASCGRSLAALVPRGGGDVTRPTTQTVPGEVGTGSVVLAFFLPGILQMSKGQATKGVVMLAVAIIGSFVLPPIPWLLMGAWSAFDLNSQRQRG
jgi:TM2 domain-containing membrane protein YozV